MAERLVFISNEIEKPGYYTEDLISFTFYSGFAITQKQKSIFSLHENIKTKYPDSRVLEISTKSNEGLGVRLSAFNLMYFDEASGKEYHLENVFQASKVYENGGPYKDLLETSPKNAKGDTRHHTSGKLTCFKLNDWECQLEPKTMFYDWLYCKSLSQKPELAEALVDGGYNAFTDIEFNQKKSFNCQARAAAIFVSLYNKKVLYQFLDDKEKWPLIYGVEKADNIVEQLSFNF